MHANFSSKLAATTEVVLQDDPSRSATLISHMQDALKRNTHANHDIKNTLTFECTVKVIGAFLSASFRSYVSVDTDFPSKLAATRGVFRMIPLVPLHIHKSHARCFEKKRACES